MTSRPSIARRRSLRRPRRAYRFAAVALLGLAVSIGLPPAALAQELDPEDMASELEATIDQVDQAFEGGGAVAPAAPAPPAVPTPPVAPVPPAPTPEPALSTPSETATVPAPESTVEEPDPVVPTAPSAPTNINVDIRILSPGDNGDVTQEIENIVVPQLEGIVNRGGVAAPGGGSDETWNWTWRWTSGCEPDMRASSAAWNWTWDWEQGCDAAVPDDPDLSGFIPPEFRDDFISAPQPPEPAPPGETTAEEDLLLHLPGSSGGPRDQRKSQSGGADHAPDLMSGTAPTGLLTTVADASGGQAPVGSNRVRAAQGRRQQSAVRQRAPEQAPPALPSAAASGLSGGGSSAALGAVLLALLCLLAPRALGLAAFPTRRLSSQLSSSRPERPG